MSAKDIAAALRRVAAVLRRRPRTGLQEDTPAAARWDGGLRAVTSHPDGTRIVTDVPSELGGGGGVTPGWFMRAGLASCEATRIAMSAALAGIELKSLEVIASSRSDASGLLDLAGPDGARVSAAPRDVELRVRLCAPGVAPERLRALVEDSHHCSPVACAVQEAVPVALRIEIEAEAEAG